MLNAVAVEQFKRDGYFIARGVFDDAELKRLRELAVRVKEKACQNFYVGTRYWYPGGDVNTLPPEQRALATWGVDEITRRELFEPELVNVFAHPKINQAMHALLGDAPRAWGIKILWTPKLANYDLQWHRDFGDKSLYDYVMYKPQAQDHVQFNAALYADSNFIVIPGSHRRALTEQEWQAVNDQTTDDLPGQVTAELQAGDIVYMDAHALHRGRSDINSERLTLHYSAQAQWVPLKEWGQQYPGETFQWLLSDAFVDQLAPAAQPYYWRLRTAERTDDALIHIRQSAQAHGWQMVTT